MSDRDDLGDALVDLVDGSAAPVTFDEVAHLAHSARPLARRRSRRIAYALGLAAVVLAPFVVLVVFRSPRTSVDVLPQATSTSASSTASSVPPASTYADGPPTGDMGAIGPGSGWRIDGLTFSRTDDDGAHWRDITPPLAVGQDPIARISSPAFFGSQDVWAPVAVNDSPFTIYRSLNGGATWQVMCTGDQCGPSSNLTFLDADHGFGLGYVTGNDDARLFATSDGGKSWTARGRTPFFGPMQFVNVDDGWAVSEPSGYGGSSGLPTKPGGALYRTTDGGRTWQRVHLPELANARAVQTFAGMPQFFGEDGVVVAWLDAQAPGSHDRVAVYATHDGGDTWSGQLAPADPAADRYGETTTHGRDLTAPYFPFSAASANDWMLFIGPNLYVTHDAGDHWQTLTPRPALGPVQQVDATSASSAWALAEIPTCATPTEQQPCRMEELLRTTDSGETWPAVALPPGA